MRRLVQVDTGRVGVLALTAHLQIMPHVQCNTFYLHFVAFSVIGSFKYVNNHMCGYDSQGNIITFDVAPQILKTKLKNIIFVSRCKSFQFL